jgi:hypothetical protein
METARGRWFLTEYARRNRNSDTRLVLEMLARVERNTARRTGSLEAERLRGDLVEVSEAISRAKTDMAKAGTEASAAEVAREAPKALETIVVTSERTTGDVLNATERVQEVAWMLRERGMPASICNELDTLTAEIYSVCSAQDLNHRRIVLLTDLLRFLEGRVETMLAAKRREDAEARSVLQAIDDGRIPVNLHVPVTPTIAPEAARAPAPAWPAPRPASTPVPFATAPAQAPAPKPDPLTAAMAELNAVAEATASPAAPAAAPAPQTATASPAELAIAAALAPAPPPANDPTPPPRPARPNFERLTATERMALFS